MPGPLPPADRLPDVAVTPAPVAPPVVTPDPVTPAPVTPMTPAPGGAGGFGENLGAAPAPVTPPAAAPDALAQAQTQTATGRVDEYDPLRRTLTLENGDTFILAANVPGADTLTPGTNVTLTYRMSNEQRIVQGITRPAAPAAPGVPDAAPMAPGAVPLPVTS